MGEEDGRGDIVRLGESTDFVEVDGWRRALERAGVRARLVQQNDPYLGGRYLLYVFQRDVDEAVRVLGWVPDPSLVDPAYAEEAGAARRSGGGGRLLPAYVPLLALILALALLFALLAALLS